MSKKTLKLNPNTLQSKLLDVEKLWAQRKEGYINGKAGTDLYWCSLTSENHVKAVVVIGGRIESAWKYQELFYDLYLQGYDVFSFDHRGQGLSGRLTKEPHMGHVEQFSDYIDDMETVLQSFNLPKYQKRFILAHSMGGAIATRYLQTTSNHSFNGMLLSAPMFGVNLSPFMQAIAPHFTRIISILSPYPTYATRNKAYAPKPFTINPLTSSEERYRWFRQLYEDMPQLQLGGPSAQWVYQSLAATRACFEDTDKLTLPVLILQASKDTIVSNQAQNELTRKLQSTNSDAQLKVMHNSKHEILFENDFIRQEALEEIMHFFAYR